MTQFLPIALALAVAFVGCDNRDEVEVPSNAGQGLAPAEIEVQPHEEPTPADPRPVAWIGDEPIEAEAVEVELARIRRMYRDRRRPWNDTVATQKREQVVQRLIDERLIERWQRGAGVEVAEEEIDQAVREKIDAVFGSRAVLREHLDRRQTTMDEFRTTVRRDIATRKLLAADEEPAPPDAGVPDGVTDLYSDVANRPGLVTRFRLSSILFGPSVTLRDAHRELAGITDERAFVRLAAQRGKREPGLGWVEQTALDARLASELSKVDPPGLSRPIKTPAGFQVYWVHERKRQPSDHFNELRPVLEQRQEAMTLSRKREELLRRLRESADIRLATAAD